MVLLCNYFCYNFFTLLDWNLSIHLDTISIYQVVYNQIGPVIGLSLSSMKDFSWILRYRGYFVLVDQCSLLQDIPSVLNSGMLIDVIKGSNFVVYGVSQLVLSFKVCERNSEDHLTS